MVRVQIAILTALALLVVSSCAGYRPIVDMRGVDQAQYEQDLAECQSYAQQVNPAGQALAGGIIGAAVGAAFGAAIGAAWGDPGGGAAIGAAAGGTTGVASGAADGAQGQVDVIRRCMEGRGYSVLR
jgi:outer membrane lipoprotein SlyB